MALQDTWNKIKAVGLDVAESLTPVLKHSKFRETGVLTPEEFVIAGDHLVLTCPTWSWQSGESDKIKDYLPKEKQFLVTKQVPCHKRCKDIQYSGKFEKVIEDDGPEGDGGWVDTHHGVSTEEAEEKTEVQAASEVVEEDDDDEICDMEDFEDDDDLVIQTDKLDLNIEKTRTYDLSITYDKFYQTPRLWLSGYNEEGIPLKIDQMYEDISQEHANKTVTFEQHSSLSSRQCSVHPCKHASVMKKLIEVVSEGGRDLGVHEYILVFLKFIQAVIPTIEYDFTKSFHLH